MSHSGVRLCVAVAALLLVAVAPAAADPAKPSVIHVRGETHVVIRWQHDARPGTESTPWLRLEGQALDDADHPLAKAVVTLGLLALEGGPPPDLTRAVSCAESPASLPRNPDGTLLLETDTDGRFCLRLPLAVAKYRVHAEARWEPTKYDAAALDQDLDFGKPPVSLWLEGGDTKPDLGKPTYVLSARIGYEDLGRLVYAPGLPVDWVDEKGAVLASGTSGPDGHLRFELATSALGDPGLVRHRLESKGSPALGPTTLVFPLEKRAHLALVLETAPTDVTAGVELPYAFRVQVALPPGSDPARTLFAPQALVQATYANGQLVGTAEADPQGHVLVPVLLATGDQSGAIEFRATAQVPFLLPSDPLRIPVEVSAPRSWRSLWLLAGFLALVAWLAIGRAPQRRKPADPKRAAAAKGAAPPVPRAEVLVTEEAAGTRWNGSVKDAHDRTPVVGARVTLVRPGFAGRSVLAETGTGTDGAFVLDAEMRAPGDRLVIDAPYHRTLDAEAPAFGAVTITTISRRRGVLHDFARWAQSRPWAGALRRKPTPLDAAVRDEEHAVWAARVDDVVFGPQQVDAAREASATVPTER